MSWSYNKEKPWLSGIMNKRDTQRWVMMKPAPGGSVYFTGRNNWSPWRSDAKLLDNGERAAYAQHKEDGHWFELVHD